MKIKLFYNTFIVPCEKSNAVSFTSSIIENIFAFRALSKFAAKLICRIALGSVSRACCLLKCIAIILQSSLK